MRPKRLSIRTCSSAIAAATSSKTLGRARFRDKNPDERPTQKQIAAELSDDEKLEQQTLTEELRQSQKLPELSQGRVMREGDPRAATSTTAAIFANRDRK